MEVAKHCKCLRISTARKGRSVNSILSLPVSLRNESIPQSMPRFTVGRDITLLHMLLLTFLRFEMAYPLPTDRHNFELFVQKTKHCLCNNYIALYNSLDLSLYSLLPSSLVLIVLNHSLQPFFSCYLYTVVYFGHCCFVCTQDATEDQLIYS